MLLTITTALLLPEIEPACQDEQVPCAHITVNPILHTLTEVVERERIVHQSY